MTMIRCLRALCLAVLTGLSLSSLAQSPQAAGTLQGLASVHTAASLAASIEQAQVALPASATGTTAFFGRYRDAPLRSDVRVPVVLFMHGSSGLGLAAIGEWQRWLAGLGIASLAPDSFALPQRITYTSPIDVSTYEKIHAMRAAEIQAAVQALANMQWADRSRLVLAGTSEGAVPVAR